MVDSGLRTDTFNVVCGARLRAERSATPRSRALRAVDDRSPGGCAGDEPRTSGRLTEGSSGGDGARDVARALDRARDPSRRRASRSGCDTPRTSRLRADQRRELEPPDAAVEACYRTSAPTLLAGDSPQRIYVALRQASPSPPRAHPRRGRGGIYNLSTRVAHRRRGIGGRCSSGRVADPRSWALEPSSSRRPRAGREPLSVLRLSGVRPDRGAQALPFVASDKIYYVKYDIRRTSTGLYLRRATLHYRS